MAAPARIHDGEVGESRPRAASRLAWPVFWLCLALLGMGTALNVAAHAPDDEGIAKVAFFALTFPATPFVGALLASRRPADGAPGKWSS